MVSATPFAITMVKLLRRLPNTWTDLGELTSTEGVARDRLLRSGLVQIRIDVFIEGKRFLFIGTGEHWKEAIETKVATAAGLMDGELTWGEQFFEHRISHYGEVFRHSFESFSDEELGVRLPLLQAAATEVQRIALPEPPPNVFTPWLDIKQFKALLTASGEKSLSGPTITRRKKDLQAEGKPGTNNRDFRFRIATLQENGISIPDGWV